MLSWNLPGSGDPQCSRGAEGSPNTVPGANGEKGAPVLGPGSVRAVSFPQRGAAGWRGPGLCANRRRGGLEGGGVCWANRLVRPPLPSSLSAPWPRPHSASSVVSPQIHIYPELHNLTLFGKGVFTVSLAKDLRLKSSRVEGGPPIQWLVSLQEEQRTQRQGKAMGQ